MPRPRSVDPEAVVQAIRDGAYAAEAARTFKISRVRVRQILDQYAPDLVTNPTHAPTLTPEEKAARRELIAETKKALKEHSTITAAAKALGLTNSGLYMRMSRLGIQSPAQKQREARQKAILVETKKALKENPTLVAAAEALGIKVSGLTARRAKLGLIERKHDPVT